MPQKSEMVAFVDRICKACTEQNDLDLWGTCYTMLPFDATGKAIHIGDMVSVPSHSEPSRVVGIGVMHNTPGVFLHEPVNGMFVFHVASVTTRCDECVSPDGDSDGA